MQEKEDYKSITPFSETEKECLAAGCKEFVVWNYYDQELHSCNFQGESDTIMTCADCKECPIKNSR